MYSHRTMWRAIDRLARDKGWTMQQLAIRSGLDPTALNPSKRLNSNRKPRWPSTETLAKVLSATGTQFSEFCALLEGLPPDDRREGASEPRPQARDKQPRKDRATILADIRQQQAVLASDLDPNTRRRARQLLDDAEAELREEAAEKMKPQP